jgi:branched-chain amino acid aminotransferase
MKIQCLMQQEYAVKNGVLVKKEDANISVFNKSLFFDFAVYSNIKVVQGKMFLPDFEIERLFESAKIIGIEHNFEKEKILEWGEKLIEANNLKDSLIRLLLIGPQKDSESILFLFSVGLTFYPSKFYNQGVKVATYLGERTFPNVKSKDLLLGYVAYGKSAKENAIDALLIDKDGNIREGTRSSFFAVKDNTLIMPPKEKILEGITRKIMAEVAEKIMKVKEENIPLKDIKKYDEFFITGTTLNVMPIREIDGIDVWKGCEKTKELQRLFKEYCDKH